MNPSYGDPVLVRPLPGKLVARDGAKGQFLPTDGAVVPYSLHWQQMAQAGAIEWPRTCPPWKTPVKITPAAEGVQLEGKPLPKEGVVLPWSPALRDLVLQQRVHFPTAPAAPAAAPAPPQRAGADPGVDPTPGSSAPAAAETAAPVPAEKE